MRRIWPKSREEVVNVAGTLRRAVRSSSFVGILGGRHVKCAYYFDFCRLCLMIENQPEAQAKDSASLAYASGRNRAPLPCSKSN